MHPSGWQLHACCSQQVGRLGEEAENAAIKKVLFGENGVKMNQGSSLSDGVCGTTPRGTPEPKEGKQRQAVNKLHPGRLQGKRHSRSKEGDTGTFVGEDSLELGTVKVGAG